MTCCIFDITSSQSLQNMTVHDLMAGLPEAVGCGAGSGAAADLSGPLCP